MAASRHIVLSAASLEADALPRGPRLIEHAPGDPTRANVERFIAERFASAHGARVGRFMPALIGLNDRSGDLRCALGYRGAGTERLFLEQYLDTPIEQSLAAAIARHGAPPPAEIRRDQIAEVGHLAGRGCRFAMLMLARLPAHLMDRGYRWISFTATDRVREILERFGAPLVDLGAADPARLAGDASDWGDYYRRAPRVMAGWLPNGLRFAR